MHLPLSFSQTCLLKSFDSSKNFDDQHTVVSLFPMPSEFNQQALELAANTLINSHSALRMSVVSNSGIATIKVHESCRSKICVLNNSNTEHGHTFNELMRDGFDIHTGPLIKFTAFVSGNGFWSMAISAHHMIVDGRSMEILKEQLISIYNNHLSGHSEVKISSYQYDDYIETQYNRLNAGLLDNQIAYWRDVASKLRFNGRKFRYEESGQAKFKNLIFSGKEFSSAVCFAKENRVSLFSYFTHAFFCALTKLFSTDIPFLETAFSGRSTESMNECVGYFANNGIIVNDFSQERMKRNQLSCLNEQIFNSLEAQDVPIGYLIINKYEGFDINYNSTAGDIRSKIQMQNFTRSRFSSFRPRRADDGFVEGKYVSRAIRLVLVPIDYGMLIHTEYRADILSEKDIAELLELFSSELANP